MSKLNLETILKILNVGENKVKSNDQMDQRCSFASYPDYKKIKYMKEASLQFNIQDPFFKLIDARASATCMINGEQFINFSSYNYLNLNGDDRVNEAACEAIRTYGTSASASRMVSGERPIHKTLEQMLAQLHGAQNALAFVSGHATNVTTIGCMFGPKDLIIHDEYIHNSAIEGIKLSGATKCAFAHNDWQALDKCLELRRQQYDRVLVIIEGHYSMDGDYPDLPEFIRVKKRHQAFLMVDEAHSIGVLGNTGRGICEFFNINGEDVDIWMGTLSKTLASCGGYIAGSDVLIELLKYSAPGFIYSTSISPPLAAASCAALDLMFKEPERIQSLHTRANQFLTEAKQHGLNTGLSKGVAIIPIICGSSRKAVELSNRLFQRKINILPIIYPAVPERQARLRCFISSAHTKEQISHCVREISAAI